MQVADCLVRKEDHKPISDVQQESTDSHNDIKYLKGEKKIFYNSVRPEKLYLYKGVVFVAYVSNKLSD